MRWVNDVAVAALAAGLLSSGCGNYSTEDIRFLSALPHREDLHVAVPAEAPPPAAGLVSAAAVCPAPGEASLWLQAKGTSDGLNRGVDFIVGLIDRVRKVPPTERYEDSRRWGPFDDEKHDGREIQIVMNREWPDGKTGAPTYEYMFQGRVKGDSGFSDLITGTFEGASSAQGNGEVTLFFETFHSLGVADADTPHGKMIIKYFRASEPERIELTLEGLAGAGWGVLEFGYFNERYASDDGTFRYRLVNGLSGDVLNLRAAWNPTKAGRLGVDVVAPPSTVIGSFDQCWDANGCLVYVRDPGNFSCPVGPCSFGVVGSCPTVLVPPF